MASVPWFYAYHYRHNADLRDAVADARAGEGRVLSSILIFATDNAWDLGLNLSLSLWVCARCGLHHKGTSRGGGGRQAQCMLLPPWNQDGDCT